MTVFLLCSEQERPVNLEYVILKCCSHCLVYDYLTDTYLQYLCYKYVSEEESEFALAKNLLDHDIPEPIRMSILATREKQAQTGVKVRQITEINYVNNYMIFYY